MQRFYTSEPLGGQLKRDGDFSHQFLRVLRSDIGDTCVFFNGNTIEYTYQLTEISGSKKHPELIFDFVSSTTNPLSMSTDFTLYQALPNKIDKLELIIQKGVEIGVTHFVFFPSDRSQKLVLTDKKLGRLEKIAQEATEQSQSPYLPGIIFQDVSIDFSELPGDIIILDPTGNRDNSELVSSSMLVGPEGGWSDEEISTFIEQKLQRISFGERIMRLETAAICGSFYFMKR